MKILIYFTALFFSQFVILVAYAHDGANTKDAPILISDKANQPVALLGLTFVGYHSSGCYNHMGLFEVEEIAYEGVSEIVGGIRVNKIKPGLMGRLLQEKEKTPVLMRFDIAKMSNVEKSWVPTLVQKGNRLLIAYNVCGNGGYHFARDIYKEGALDW